MNGTDSAKATSGFDLGLEKAMALRLRWVEVKDHFQKPVVNSLSARLFNYWLDRWEGITTILFNKDSLFPLFDAVLFPHLNAMLCCRSLKRNCHNLRSLDWYQGALKHIWTSTSNHKTGSTSFILLNSQKFLNFIKMCLRSFVFSFLEQTAWLCTNVLNVMLQINLLTFYLFTIQFFILQILKSIQLWIFRFVPAVVQSTLV